jgi:hypothetical protein
MDPCFLHRDRWPAWAAEDKSAQPDPPTEQLWCEDPTMEEASAKAAEVPDRAEDDGGGSEVGPRGSLRQNVRPPGPGCRDPRQTGYQTMQTMTRCQAA